MRIVIGEEARKRWVPRVCFAMTLVYLVMVLSFSLVGWALYRHYCLWMQGRPENRVQDLWRRLKVMLVQGLGQQKTLREGPGLLHFCVYAGFIVLFIGTLMVAVHEDLGLHFLYGNFYLFYSLTLDVFGLLCASRERRAREKPTPV